MITTMADINLGKQLLNQVDIALISFFRQRALKPVTMEEFWELLKVLDNDNYIYEALVSLMPKIEPSITAYYRKQDKIRVELLVRNI